MGKGVSQIDIALKYAERGIKIFPCTQQKRPAIRGGDGFHDATDDIDTIRAWWEKYPNALIGAPNNQFVVIDVDGSGLCVVN